MSNQFFNYIVTYISKFFHDRGVESGERYYLRLDSAEDVKYFKDAVKDSIVVDQFRFPLETGRDYITDMLPISNELIIAYNDETVSTDFLVTLRNKVSDQFANDIFTGKALLSVISSDLDSIIGGSISLSSEGMLLSPAMMSSKIKNDIEERVNSESEKIILQEYIEHLDKERKSHFINFYDYQEILKVINKGFLEDADYYNMGLFKDENLYDYPTAQQKKRIEENKNFFSIVKTINDNNYDKSELEKYFLQREVNKLVTDEWSKIPFSDLKISNEERKKQSKKTVFNLKELKVDGGKGHFVRNPAETAVGLRKHHIMVFADGESPAAITAHLEILYSEQNTLNKTYLKENKKRKFDVDLKRTKIVVNLPSEIKEPMFDKVIYKHENKSNLSIELHIVYLPFPVETFIKQQHSYLVEVTKERLSIPLDNYTTQFGPDLIDTSEIKVNTNEQIIHLNKDQTQLIEINDELSSADEDIIVFLEKDNAKLKLFFESTNNKIIPITPSKLNNLIREKGISFEYSEGVVIGQQYQYSLPGNYRKFIEMELEWLNKGMFMARYNHDFLVKDDDHDLPDDLKESYSRFINTFKSKSVSLTAWNEEIKKEAFKYVQCFNHYIEQFQSNAPAGKIGMSLFNIGTVHSEKEVYLTPFHPLNVAYKLKELEDLSGESLEVSIYERLKPDALLPFMYAKGKGNTVYSPDQNTKTPGWIRYTRKDTANVSDADLYLNKVVKNKLKQFKKHYGYYFVEGAKAPFKVQAINILNDYQLVRGIIEWYLEELSMNIEDPLLVEVLIIRSNLSESFIETFINLKSAAELAEKFNLNLSLKNKDLSDEEVFNIMQKNVVFKSTSNLDDIEYSHVAFYKMHTSQEYAVQDMNLLESGVSMDGLYASIPSKKFTEDYRSGFGSADLQKDNILLRTAYNTNELAANLENNSKNTYVKNRGIVSMTSYEDRDLIEKILTKPIWVTFIDPGVELDFFESLHDDLVIIHYNDQYSSSTRYDAVTVTSKSKQFNRVIEEYLDSVDIANKHEQKSVESIISAFNTINGEWLLKIVGSRGYFAKEKLSIIAAIKASLAYLTHPEIIWVPISLEEILRVAGAANLNKRDGIFTAKNLGVTGQHSDDILFVGLNKTEEQLKFHLYPVEVKIGINDDNVIKKAEEQLNKTVDLLREELIDKSDSFTQKFYRNFFAQLFISNANRIVETKFGDFNNYVLSLEELKALKSGNYGYDLTVQNHIGKGSIFSFTKDYTSRSNNIDPQSNILKITLFEEDVKKCLTMEHESLVEWLIGKKSEFIHENILFYNYKAESKKSLESYGDKIQEKFLK